MHPEVAMKKIVTISALALAAAFSVASGASAQVADSAKKDSAAARPSPQQNRPDANRPVGAISDSAIIAMLQLSHTQEIAAAELAVTRAQSPRVKQFAEKLKTEHGVALQELQAYAEKLRGGVGAGVVSPDSARSGRDNNVTGRPDSITAKPDRVPPVRDSAVAAPPPPAGQQPDVDFDNLPGLSGHEFDHGFVRLQVKHHQTEIERLRNDVIPMIKDSGLKVIVQRELPKLGAHLREAQELEAHLKTTN
jgi:predicted outer membrane protein